MKVPKLHDCCHYFSLSTGSWIIGWWNVVYCSLVISTNSILLMNLKLENGDDKIHADHMFKMTIFVKVLQLAFTVLLLIGTYKGHRTLIFCWIIANATLTLVSAALYLMMLSSSYSSLEIVFTVLTVLDIYCILVVTSYYRDVETTF